MASAGCGVGRGGGARVVLQKRTYMKSINAPIVMNMREIKSSPNDTSSACGKGADVSDMDPVNMKSMPLNAYAVNMIPAITLKSDAPGSIA